MRKFRCDGTVTTAVQPRERETIGKGGGIRCETTKRSNERRGDRNKSIQAPTKEQTMYWYIIYSLIDSYPIDPNGCKCGATCDRTETDHIVKGAQKATSTPLKSINHFSLRFTQNVS